MVNPQKIKSHFYHFQPIELSQNAFFNLNFKNINPDILLSCQSKKIPIWMSQFNSINMGLYDNLHNIDINMNMSNHKHIFEITLKKFFEEHPFNSKISLSSYFTKCDLYLFYDFNSKYFMLEYDFIFEFDNEIFNNIVNLSLDNNNIDLYNYIRNITVKNNDINSIFEPFEAMILQLKEDLIQVLFCNHSDITLQDILIIPNTSNMTHVINNLEIIGNDDTIVAKLQKMNEIAEIREDDTEPFFKVNGNDLYLFKSRFHTIIIQNPKNEFRYIPIQFYMQSSWFYLIMLNKMLKELENYSHNTSTLSKEQLASNNYIIDSILKNLIYIFRHNSTFKHTIENDAITIYKKIEKKWHIEKSLEELKNDMLYFQQIIENNKNIETKQLLIKIDTLENEKRELIAKNETDSLTRAFTRAVFKYDLTQRLGQDLISVIFIDADKFKSINDNYGHQIGDEVLKILVNKMFESIKFNKIQGKVYRYGGEEFLMLIEGLEKFALLGFLEYLRKEIESLKIELNEPMSQILTFTVSMGVAFLEKNDTIESVVKRADINVYKAKENGRNRIEY